MIRFRGAGFSYGGGGRVLDGVDLEIGTGLTLLLGPNGCGKSTLLKLAAGVERPDAGAVSVEGHDLWRDEVAARRSLAYVPEQPDLTPYATVEEVLRLVAALRSEPDAAAGAALTACGLRGVEGRSIRQLSMGQRRRAVLAAAMIGTPRVVLLDEPLEAMDRPMREAIVAWVEEHRAAGRCVVVVTHDFEPFSATAARALTVRHGRPLLHDPLPAGARERSAILESLSRGIDPGQASSFPS